MISRDTGQKMKDKMVLLYKLVDPYLYGCVQFFKQTGKQISVKPYRQSAPFVILQSIGEGKEFIYGSVFELIREIHQLFDELNDHQHQLSSVLHGSGIITNKMPDDSGRFVQVTIPGGKDADKIFFEYTRKITNTLLLISCQTRNLFHIFNRLNDKKVSVLDYEGKTKVGEINVKELCDYFVHNRYIFVDGQYIADLFSEKFAKHSSISKQFMGYKIDWREYVTVIRHAINSVKVKDLVGLLRRDFMKLEANSPQNKIVFLIQNLESLSRFLQTKIQTKKYSSMLSLLFDSTINKKIVDVGGHRSSLNCVVTFTSPHIKIHEDLDEKKIKIQAKCKFSFGEKATQSHSMAELEKFSKEVGYEEFFNQVNTVFGNEPLVGSA